MSNRNPTNEKQHYVPEVVLSVFAEGAGTDKLYMFDKHSARRLPGPTAVNKLCKEGGFYTAEARHGIVSVEAAFHELEDEYRSVVSKIVVARSLADLTSEELGSLIGFVCVQYLRVPRLRKSFEQVTKLIADKARGIAPGASNLAEFELSDNDLRVQHLAAIAGVSVEATRLLSRYSWFVMEADGSSPLWISDCPVVMHNNEKGFYAGLGFGSPGIQIYFPLTPTLMLACWHPVVAGRFLTEHESAKKQLSQMKATHLLRVGADRPRLAAAIEKLEAGIRPIEPVVNAIKTGGSVRLSRDNVLHFNWLQFQWSYRFLLCASGDFQEAEKMLSENPDLKTGITMGS